MLMAPGIGSFEWNVMTEAPVAAGWVVRVVNLRELGDAVLKFRGGGDVGVLHDVFADDAARIPDARHRAEPGKAAVFKARDVFAVDRFQPEVLLVLLNDLAREVLHLQVVVIEAVGHVEGHVRAVHPACRAPVNEPAGEERIGQVAVFDSFIHHRAAKAHFRRVRVLLRPFLVRLPVFGHIHVRKADAHGVRQVQTHVLRVAHIVRGAGGCRDITVAGGVDEVFRPISHRPDLE